MKMRICRCLTGWTTRLAVMALAGVGVPALAQTDVPYQVTGRVVNLAGEPVTGARVCGYPLERGPAFGASCTRSGNEGSFVLTTRTGGRHQVMADDPQGGHISQMRPFFRLPGVPVVVVVLDATNPSPMVTIVLAPRNGSVTLRVTDAETGWPPDTIRFALCHAGNRSNCYVTERRNEDGVHTLAAPHVPFVIEASTPTHEPWPRPTDTAAATMMLTAGESREMTIALDRKPAFRGVAITEQEKQRGVHLPEPVQVSPADGALLDAYPGRLTRLEWQPVPGAVSYTVEVDACSGGQPSPGCVEPFPLHRDQPPLSGITGTSYPLTFIGAQPGRWRVYAVDALGRAGFKSPWRVFVHRR